MGDALDYHGGDFLIQLLDYSPLLEHFILTIYVDDAEDVKYTCLPKTNMRVAKIAISWKASGRRCIRRSQIVLVFFNER